MIRVYWDTMVLVYWLESHADFGPRVLHIRDAMKSRGDRLVASPLSLCELLVLPTRRGEIEAVRRIEQWYRAPGVEQAPLSPDIAPHFARIRAQYHIAVGDALHLAAAAAAGVDVFLTNDRRLKGVHVPGIKFIVGLDTDLY